jgi:hypothetical protein
LKRFLARIALGDPIEGLVPATDHAVHSVHSFLARYLTSRVPAHPVRNDVQP